MKKFLSGALLLLVLVPILTISVFANSPVPADHLTFILSNLPDEAVYAELLVKMSTDDPNFVEYQSNSFSDVVSNSHELVRYSEDGFYSFTFHFKNAMSNIKIEHYYEDRYYVDFCNGLEYEEYLTQYEALLNRYNEVKIALLDENFDIIFVSSSTQLPKEHDAINFYGDVDYDCEADLFECDTSLNLLYVIYLVVGNFISFVIFLLSIGSETLVAFLFKFKGKQVATILAVNACSQAIMRLLYFVLSFTYLTETIVLEILVYALEFLFYFMKFKDTKVSKIALYTVVANTLSLLQGILIDSYF